MKRFFLISSAIIVLLLVTFVLQNRFLFGIPFVQKDKTTWADLDRLLGKRYVMVYMNSRPPGLSGRIYFVHYDSYLICEYDLELSGDGESYLKDRVDSVTWKKDMVWDRLGFLKELDRLAKQQ